MILVTGASGYVGSKLVKLLASHGATACVRNFSKAPGGVPVRIADFDDFNSLIRAFGRTETLIFIPSDGTVENVGRHCKNVFEAAKFVGVEHVIFLSIVDVAEDSSFYYAPMYREAERQLSDTGLPFTIARCGLYKDFVECFFVDPVRESGVLSLPASDARVSPISRDDVALRLAEIAKTHKGNNEVITLLGEATESFADIAAANGLSYENCSPETYLVRLKGEKEEPWPHAFSTLFQSIREGRFA